ncbi:MAG: hypothetical protein A2293_14645 [Elusimicrobia bacterium RIFOXYB2_FULL_49_7]|nr:MAG: hypothetical protein A2293_14645 [Elusimicrobia bacterium RIFOXYB2_FULL_49_7]
MRMTNQVFFVAMILLGMGMAFSRSIICQYPIDMSNAINNALPGDTILLTDRVWGLTRIPSDRNGTLDSPIVLKALNPVPRKIDSLTTRNWNLPSAYGVIINTSNSDEGILFSSSYWVFEDIYFDGGNVSVHSFHIVAGSRGHLTYRGCCFTRCLDKYFKINFTGYDTELFPVWADAYWPDYILIENCVAILGIAGFVNNDGSDFLTCRNNLNYGLQSGGPNYNNFSKGGVAYSIYENNVVWGGKPLGSFSLGGGSMAVPSWCGFRHDSDLCAGLPGRTYETVNSIIRNNVIVGPGCAIQTSTTMNCEAYNNTIINCATPLLVECHHGIPIGYKFYNNLLVGCGTLTTTYGQLSNNTVLTAPFSKIFQQFLLSPPPGAGIHNDYRIKPDSATRVGTGRLPFEHSDWPAWYALPSTEFYDLYGKVRANPPVIGAAELYDGTPLPDNIEKPDLEKQVTGIRLQVEPNPANPSTQLVLDLQSPQPLVDVLIRDITGHHVRSLYYGPMTAGRHAIRWDGRNHDRAPVASGVYIFRVSFGKEVLFQKFQLVR